MNIFFLDKDPKKAAQYHVNKHVVKMPLELAQLLSTAHHVNGTQTKNMYKQTHTNHPSAIWVRESAFNYLWTWMLYIYLCEEYTFRYGKVHKVQALRDTLSAPTSGLDEHTPLRLAMPDKYKTNDPVESYRNYYIGDKQHLFSWKKRQQPEWIHDLRDRD